MSETELPTPSIPEGYNICLRGFADEDVARKLGNDVGNYLRSLSRFIDVSNLDGLTVAYDYAQALLELDRGYETTRQLTASSGDAIGVAMTPSVIRNGKLRSHIVINGGLAEYLSDPKGEHFDLALHTLAHECAHVEVTNRFDEAFPNTLLQKSYGTYVEALQWEVILACWDEYAVCRICARIGAEPTNGYEEVFLGQLESAPEAAKNSIIEYRIHGDLDRMLAEVLGAYGNLMKFASYHIGNLRGLDIAIDDRERTNSALSGHWFEPFFCRLADIHDKLFAQYGVWQDKADFEAIGALAQSVLAERGVIIRPEGDNYYVDVPFSPETMPLFSGLSPGK